MCQSFHGTLGTCASQWRSRRRPCCWRLMRTRWTGRRAPKGHTPLHQCVHADSSAPSVASEADPPNRAITARSLPPSLDPPHHSSVPTLLGQRSGSIPLPSGTQPCCPRRPPSNWTVLRPPPLPGCAVGGRPTEGTRFPWPAVVVHSRLRGPERTRTLPHMRHRAWTPGGTQCQTTWALRPWILLQPPLPRAPPHQLTTQPRAEEAMI